MSTLQLTVFDEGYQVDISPAYFQRQIKGILEKNSTKAIEVKALVFHSPGVASLPRKKKLVLVTSQCLKVKVHVEQNWFQIFLTVLVATPVSCAIVLKTLRWIASMLQAL